MDTPRSVRIALWGTFDVERYGDALFPRLTREELLRRLPGARIRVFSPLGGEHLTRFDDEEPPEPLGTYGPSRLAAFADDFDCVVVGPGDIVHGRDEALASAYGVAHEEIARRAPGRFFIEGLGPELEEVCPVVWHAVSVPFEIAPEEARRYRQALAGRPYVSVRDGASGERLAAAGVDREIAVVPDPLVLTPRIFSPTLLDERLEYLRVTGRFPAEGSALVVQGGAEVVPLARELGAALERLVERNGLSVVVAETGSDERAGQLGDALEDTLPGRVRRLGPVGARDLAAAIAGSAGFVGTSLHGTITALAFGRPSVVLAPLANGPAADPGVEVDADATPVVRRPDDLPAAFERAASAARATLVAEWETRLDRHFDRLAGVAAEAARKRGDAPGGGPASDEVLDRLAAVTAALEARGRLLAEQRWRFADRVQEAEARERRTREALEREIRRLEAERARLKAEVAGKDRELRTLLNTRTFRYTAGLRRAWGALRGVLRG